MDGEMGMMVMLLLMMMIMDEEKEEEDLSDDLMLLSEPVCFPLPASANTPHIKLPYSN